jgi:hypothetical protein
MAGFLTATEPVYVTDPNGVRRLIAAPGDAYDPATIPVVGVVTLPDAPESGVEPFDGYDDLTEAEVVALLPDLELEVLDAVRAYERAHLARGAIHRYGLVSRVVRSGGKRPKTVPAESTSEGYDGMSFTDLQAEVASRGLTVRSGTRGPASKRDLVAALQADDARSDSAEEE